MERAGASGVLAERLHFTIQRVIRAYPLKSIRDLGGDKTLVNTVWDQPFIRLGDEKHTLNDIEQRIIRKKFATSKDSRPVCAG